MSRFDKFIEKQTNRKLEENADYQKLRENYSKAWQLYAQAYFDGKEPITEAKVRYIIDREKVYLSQSAFLEEQIKKSIFGRKKHKKELEALKKEHIANEAILTKINKFQNFMDEIKQTGLDTMTARLESIQRTTIKNIIIENADKGVVKKEIKHVVLCRGKNKNLNDLVFNSGVVARECLKKNARIEQKGTSAIAAKDEAILSDEEKEL